MINLDKSDIETIILHLTDQKVLLITHMIYDIIDDETRDSIKKCIIRIENVLKKLES
jgi:hypothetical protein